MIKLKKYNFHNIITLLSGNLGAQLVTFVIGLFLARIYTPEDFGILGVFLSLSNILIPISCLGYEAAIVVAKDLKEAFYVSILCLSISSIFSLLLLIPILLSKVWIINLFNAPAIYPWIFLLPISVILGGLFNVLNYFNTKLKQYKEISISNILKSLSCASVQFLGSFLKSGPCMLILGQAFMNLFGNIRLLKNFLSNKQRLNFRSIINVGKRFKKFPEFYFWGVLSNNISLNVTNILINKLFSPSDVGFYSYAYKYIGFPISLIASSTGQIYFQELSEAKITGGSVDKIFKETLIKLLLIGIPIFTIIFFLVKPGFIFLFGDRWAMAGEMGRILTPLFLIRFVTSPLSMTLLVFEKQNILLIWQILLMVCTFVPFVIISIIKQNIISYLNYEVLFLSIGYILYFLSIYSVIRKQK